ncbi:ATP-grasp ribosomal peptide maturase [Nonomuraea glycinis]|uniref:ATP-grasp ribosomal peptide maturase n=1 Tax=Nonomuraea glycinis TaxID=2047744 RepID=A0A918E9B8_9ACTN|nr:ATP-grasp ribosomal peptide maturase [Nonomuraea glycinis]MCA2182629.1 ATP-grasp ribosomal peptide maturase [Nonomuraea glycinis]GGP16829.1 ATP-grasp ribosomal peptide maturase [Nonomuraea glycinis]
MASTRNTVMVITCEEDSTADLVIAALNRRGAVVVRVDPADIGPDLTFSGRIGADRRQWTGRLRTPSRDVPLENVRAVYYRRPSLWRFDELEPQARKFAVAEARQGLKGLLTSLPECRYVNHPFGNDRSEYKPAQLQAAVEVGLDVPATLITNDLKAVNEFVQEHKPIIYKSFRGVPSAPGGEVATIWAEEVDPSDVDESVIVTAHLFQAKVRKSSDARVTVVGPRVFASEITGPGGDLDWRRDDWSKLEHAPIQVPSSVVAALHAYLDHFGLVFGCFDFGLEAREGNDGPYRWTFFECNPNGQWGWLPDAEAIADAFAETLLEGRST